MGYRESMTDFDCVEVMRRTTATQNDRSHGNVATQPSDWADILALISSGDVENAFSLLKQKSSRQPLLINAKGVCLLRLGRYQEAADLFRDMVLAPGSMWMRKELPNSYKLNFAMALLLAGHPSGCQDILAEINDEQHPTVIALRAAIKRWVSDLSFWQRVNWWTGKIEPSICHPTIDFLPGDLGLDVELAPPTPIASTSSHHNTAL